MKIKFLKNLFRTTACIATAAAAAVFGMILYLNTSVAPNYKVLSGEALNLNTKIPVTAVYNGARMSQSAVNQPIGTSFNVNLKMLGIIPVSTVEVEVIDTRHVALMGSPFGIRIYTEGVLVIDITDVDTAKGSFSPARTAGIKKGDVILTIDGNKVTSNEDVSRLIEQSNGKQMSFAVMRDTQKFNVKFCPEISVESGQYRAGLWVRDSSAGIGTLTFYSPSTGIVCGLGHGICDNDTGILLPLSSGQLVGAQIVSLEKGKAGVPGELKGRFTTNLIASLDNNCIAGVYGRLQCEINVSDLTQIALKQEITDGEAQIMCTVDSSGPKLYSCTVKRKNMSQENATQNLIVKITDEQLIDKTGGIIQGMSGSPIIQNGKLIGAVTHVLIDDSTTGYGIFAENMLNEAESTAKEQRVKKAS